MTNYSAVAWWVNIWKFSDLDFLFSNRTRVLKMFFLLLAHKPNRIKRNLNAISLGRELFSPSKSRDALS